MADLVLRNSAVDTRPSSTAVLLGSEGANDPSPTLFSVASVRGGYISVFDYCAANGSTDDTAAFSAMLVAAGGRPILIPRGTAVRLASPITYSGDVYLFGGGKVLMDHSGNGLTITGNFKSHDIAFDGNSKIGHGIYINGAGRRVEMYGGAVHDLDNTVEVYGVRVQSADLVRIIGVDFYNIRCLANGSESDFTGVVRAIGLHGTQLDALVDGCTFDNVNKRNAGGTRVYEDADAVTGFATSGEFQNITVANCTFTNCGKRHFKAQGTTVGNFYKFAGNTCSSPWTGTPDAIDADNTGMFSCVSIYGGKAVVADNLFSGGVCAYFVEIGGSPVESVTISGNTYAPEYHQYSGGSAESLNNGKLTHAVVGSTLSTTCKVTITGNRFSGSHFGVDGLGQNVVIANNEFVTRSTCLRTGTGFALIVGNRCVNDGTAAGIGIIAETGVDMFVIANNEVRNYGDGIYLNTQSAVFQGSVVGNTVLGSSSVDINVQVGASFRQYLTVLGNNTEDATEPVYLRGPTGTTVGAAGGASALPATPLGYLSAFVNGTSVRIPYYN